MVLVDLAQGRRREPGHDEADALLASALATNPDDPDLLSAYAERLLQQGREAEAEAAEWLKNQEAELNLRYEKELMNPKEGLALGSISSLVMPTDLRKVLGENMNFLLRHYQPSTWQDVQREFH